MIGNLPPDVYTARDIADAAGVSEARVLDLLGRGEIRSVAAQLPIGGQAELFDFIAHDEAVRAVRALRAGTAVGSYAGKAFGELVGGLVAGPAGASVGGTVMSWAGGLAGAYGGAKLGAAAGSGRLFGKTFGEDDTIYKSTLADPARVLEAIREKKEAENAKPEAEKAK